MCRKERGYAVRFMSSGAYTGWDDFFSRVRLPARTRYMVIFSGALKGLAGTSQARRFPVEDMDVDLRVA
jgi:hypothetical protein